MPNKGTLVLVVGTSSVGKTGACRLLQRKMTDHYLLMSTDMFFQMVNPDWGGGAPTPLSRKGFRYERDGVLLRIVHGEEGFGILTGIVKAVAAMLNAGNNILYDEMLQSPEHWSLWQPVVAAFRATVIHLHADEKTLLAREGARGRNSDLHGLALGHLASNEIESADLRIDTSNLSPEEVADKIYNHLQESQL